MNKWYDYSFQQSTLSPLIDTINLVQRIVRTMSSAARSWEHQDALFYQCHPFGFRCRYPIILHLEVFLASSAILKRPVD